MISTIDFAVWSPDEATFWASWVTAGICTAPYKYTAEYPGVLISDQTAQGWVPTRATGELDENGQPILKAVPGWHANIRIIDPGLIWQFTNGLPQTDENGVLLNVFERTWATYVFALTEQTEDPITSFPAGYRNNTGVTYCDTRDIKSPSNIWA